MHVRRKSLVHQVRILGPSGSKCHMTHHINLIPILMANPTTLWILEAGSSMHAHMVLCDFILMWWCNHSAIWLDVPSFEERSKFLDRDYYSPVSSQCACVKVQVYYGVTWLHDNLLPDSKTRIVTDGWMDSNKIAQVITVTLHLRFAARFNNSAIKLCSWIMWLGWRSSIATHADFRARFYVYAPATVSGQNCPSKGMPYSGTAFIGLWSHSFHKIMYSMLTNY